MIKLYLRWLFDCLEISRDNISLEIYTHENIRHNPAPDNNNQPGKCKLQQLNQKLQHQPG